MNLVSVGGRKFLLVLLTSAAVNLLVWFSKIDSSTYSLVTLGTIGAYITGNTFQKIKTSVHENILGSKLNESDK